MNWFKIKVMTTLQINQWLKAKNIKVNAIKIKKINNSFTNAVYKITADDGQIYKLRIASESPYINRTLEYYIEMQLNKEAFLYYDQKSGNYFRHWYPGKHLKKWNWNQKTFDCLQNEINKYQALEVPQSVKTLYPRYIDDVHEIKETLAPELKCYKDIIKSFDSKKFVISHNDFSAQNIVVEDSITFHVYDFEWSTLNHKLWDMGNMIKDLNLSVEQICKISQIQANLSEYVKIVFVVHFYTIFWTYRVEPTKEVLKYRKHILKRLNYWYHQVKLLKPKEAKS